MLYTIFLARVFKKGISWNKNTRRLYMDVQKKTEKNLQWHPAFYAGIQIEFKDEAENLIFENEHQLGTKPFGIDVLIIKKESEKPIQKNIGRIFRKYNIIEYKSPTDYLCVDDFYKVYGYTCFYKADVEQADSIKVEELTISLVCKNYPRKLVQHLQDERNYEVKNNGNGIYCVMGDKIPIQILVTKQLSKKENLWLRSLTNDLEESSDAEELIQEYKLHKEGNLYQSIMNIIVRANQKKFEEVRDMCQALEELMKDKFEERERIAEQLGEGRVNELNKRLAQNGRIDDIIKAAEDKVYQENLMQEFGL